MLGLMGKKIGMTQVFTAEGESVPVTVVELGPCTVVQRKLAESDGYNALQLGYGRSKPKAMGKALRGHFEKKGLPLFTHLNEFRTERAAEFEVGEELDGRRPQGGRHRQRRRHLQGPRIPGRDQALGQAWRSRGARFRLPPPPGIDRHENVAGARPEEHEAAGPHGECAHYDAGASGRGGPPGGERGAAQGLRARMPQRAAVRDAHSGGLRGQAGTAAQGCCRWRRCRRDCQHKGVSRERTRRRHQE